MFSNCFAQGNCTHPGFTTIFTGLYPINHNIVAHWTRVDLDEGIPMLAETLKKNDYITMAIDNLYDGSKDRLYPWFRRGYDHYLYPREAREEKRFGTARETTDLAIDALKRIFREDFFMFVHYWDPHQIYDPPDEYRKFYDETDAEKYKNLYLPSATINNSVSLYDGEINYVDSYVGLLLTRVNELGIGDETLIVLTSDHGEIMGENRTWIGAPDNFCHRDLYDGTIHIPLIFKGTAKVPSGRVFENLVQQVDIAPTILDILNIENVYDMDGISLFPFIKGESNSTHDVVYFSENTYQCKRGIRTKEWKFLKVMDEELYGVPPKELYDVRKDPQELLNLVDRNRAIADRLEKQMDAWVKSILKKRRKEDPLKEQDLTAGRRFRESFNIPNLRRHSQ